MSREVLDPPLQRMSNNRCYRVNMVHEDFGGNKCQNNQQNSGQQQKGYVEKDLYTEDDDDAGEDDECNIEELPNSIFKLDLHVANTLYGGLIGFKGTTRKRIESETKTEIYVPRINEKSSNVVIKGKTRSNVCSAKRKILLLIDSLRKRMRPTHFIGVALNTGEVKENFIKFKQEILDAQLPGIDEGLFTKERCIHLTLQPCLLLDDVEREKACEMLQNCRQFLTGLQTPFDIEVSGLEIMNDDPSATRVLYARVQSPDLQKFANDCMTYFTKNRLAKEDSFVRETVKLHMTVLNIRHREDVDGVTSNSNRNAEKNFDAREILKRFGDYNFGKIKCSEVHLCVMKSSREVEDFYRIASTLKF